ncbi:hypothetical protein DPMN_182023 [Dreissena polymorpha]|uniref:Uncharacterized protein n=2 Tax=Dreissena polymorpha TaxID=45954 RepID=A0A9D4I482_DREPO|nr:hypothetical protein DPMN_182023 [Dreissena polymorpha]
MDGSDVLAAWTEAGALELAAQTTRGRHVIQSCIDAGRADFSAKVNDAKREIRKLKTKKDDKHYYLKCKGKQANI